MRAYNPLPTDPVAGFRFRRLNFCLCGRINGADSPLVGAVPFRTLFQLHALSAGRGGLKAETIRGQGRSEKPSFTALMCGSQYVAGCVAKNKRPVELPKYEPGRS